MSLRLTAIVAMTPERVIGRFSRAAMMNRAYRPASFSSP